MIDNKYNDLSNAIFLSAKGLFRTMLEDGVPIPQVQGVAASLQENIQNALQMAGAQTMVKPVGPVGPSIFQFGEAPPPDDQQPPEAENPFE